MDRWKDGGQMDRDYFIGPFWPRPAGSNKADKGRATVIMNVEYVSKAKQQLKDK